MLLLGLLGLMGLGIFMVFCPETVFKIEHYLVVKEAEPSEFYITMTRIYGIVLFLITFIVFVWVGLSRIDIYAVLN